MLKRCFPSVLALAFIGLFINSASAHFVWLGSEKSGDETIGLLFFSEGPADKNYHLPAPIAEAKLFARTADGKIPTYERGQELTLDIVPEQKPGGISATVLWKGKPLAEVPVTLIDSTGEMSEEVTGVDGKVFFVVGSSGTIGLMTNHTEKDQSGESNGKKYTGKSNYATLTLNFTAGGEAPASAATEEKPAEAPSRPQRPESADGAKSDTAPFGAALPVAISSFGGAVNDGWLYVYSGHTGRAHAHSRENLSKSFVRLNLADPAKWEELPMETPLQGMALVSSGGKVYRIGGLNARNAKKEDADLHSVDEFARFDPATGTWTKLPSLPAGRSSHDATVIDGKIYVVGGWNLSGESSSGEWQNDALVYNTAAEDSGDTAAGDNGKWIKISEPPFQRRALAVAAWNGRLWALGGMDEYADIKRDVFSYDPQSDTWSKAAELPGDDMQGFGVSAWGLDSGLYASGTDGVLYRLSSVDGQWQQTAELETPRFFHRILPGGENSLLVVAGASMSDGHMKDIERIEIQ
jgi:hypothetical protein